MKTLVKLGCAGALVASTLALSACAERERAPVASSPAPPPPAQPQGVTNLQAPATPPPPAEPVQPSPAPSQPAGAGAEGVNVAPPAYGVTEEQPARLTTREDYTEQAARMIAMASQQIDRLHRWGATVGGYGRQDADEAASDITVRRDRVLQDARELQLQPPTVFESLRATLSRDLADLEASMRSSWSILPPPSSGMPPPAPLPPP